MWTEKLYLIYPQALVSIVDRSPEDITERFERKMYSFRGNKQFQLKNKIRDILNKKIKAKSVINYLYSPIDERKVLEYISLLSDYQFKYHFCDAMNGLDNKYFLKKKFPKN